MCPIAEASAMTHRLRSIGSFRSLCPARSRSILLRHHLGLKALPKDSDILLAGIRRITL
jgi:hypothetical protein